MRPWSRPSRRDGSMSSALILFHFGGTMRDLRDMWTRHDRRGQDAALDLFFDAMTGTVEQMQIALRMLAVGVDMRRYFRFLTIHMRASIHTQGVRPPDGHRDALPVTADQFHYCRDFVVETTLALQQFDAELEISP